MKNQQLDKLRDRVADYSDSLVQKEILIRLMAANIENEQHLKDLRSIKKNVQFFFWLAIISILLSIFWGIVIGFGIIAAGSSFGG